LAQPNSPIAIPEPFTVRDFLVITIPGLVLFSALFAFFFSLGNM
jgi:hypothetical protein